MQIAVFGLGYVGCITAACLAREGHEVVGVDINQAKVDMINNAQSPIVEKGLEEMLRSVSCGANGTSNHRLRAVTAAAEVVPETDVSLICVGTPSHANGSLNLDYVRNCAREIGTALKRRDGYHVVVVRSTMLPGSVETLVIPELERASNRRVGEDIGVVMNPEFLRESTSIEDFYNPPVTVIGEYDECSGATLERMYDFLDAPLVRTDIATAEMVKYTNNCFHALKVAFANEVGSICKQVNVDSHVVMDIFCMDDKLNLSPYYLKPGFAFGGSCLPKDLRAMNYLAKSKDVDVPVLNALLPSNRIHIERAIEKIVHSGARKLAILGLSFKAGTDDLRESPIVTLTEALIGKGYDLKIFDKNVALAKLFGANKEYIEKQIPHISGLMVDDLNVALEHAELVVIGNNDPEFAEAVSALDANKSVYDLVRIFKHNTRTPAGYEGICW